jgi:maltooligosyltrehalose trehalohydrolase
MHVGTLTEEGTWRAAMGLLPQLKDLGITAIEIMPITEFAGRFNWGYDTVDLFAPSHRYGTPAEFCALVDEAHRLELGVILDVVYNHLGPEGDFLDQFSKSYKSGKNQTEWGPGFDFDGPDSAPVREFFLENVAYWIRDYHVDGLRLDALQEIDDRSECHIVAAMIERARKTADPRSVLIIGENEPQQARMARPVQEGGFGLDALWNDDFHHVAFNILTGRKEAYYGDYHGTPQEFVSIWKYGFLYQGQPNARQGKSRGLPTRGIPLCTFVNYLENHDQVANSLRGDRLHRLSNPALHRAITALLLLSPGTPMLFQGQEFSASAPFHYFNEAGTNFGISPQEARIEFLSQFPSLATEEARASIADPADLGTFEASKLKNEERAVQREIYTLHRDLIRLRKDDPVFRLQGALGVDGAVLGSEAFVLRQFGIDGDDRLILTNIGLDLIYSPISEPLLAPSEGRDWSVLWSSESVDYGGDGTPPPQWENSWRLPRHSTIVLSTRP